MQNSKNVKYRAMNWMRVMAFLFIIVYHFMVELEQKGNYSFDSSLIYYSNSNLHIAIIGVSLFFMISGAGLMLSSMRKWDIKDFYRRRFTKLLIPFYIVELFTLVASFAIKQEWIAYFPFISKGKAILNLFAMDGYFEQYFPTFSLHVGEWFLGALIMLYAIFPLLRFCMEKNRYLTMIAATAYYLIIIIGNLSTISPWTNVFVKAYDFVLGMFLIVEIPRAMEKKNIRIILRILSAILILAGLVYQPVLPTPYTINNLVYALAIFILFFSLENDREARNIDKVIDSICAISYEIFLVHHIIIYYIGDNLEGKAMGLRQIGALFITEVIIMVAMALFVRGVVNLINSHLPGRNKIV
ncbi:MAG: acyltransferase [Pseudobutyrivibrio sp.]|nr:acyltransferase [Pseudobutyrivibrio sp.]